MKEQLQKEIAQLNEQMEQQLHTEMYEPTESMVQEIAQLNEQMEQEREIREKYLGHEYHILNEVAILYKPIISEIVGYKVCTWCLMNSLIDMEGRLDTITVLAAYRKYIECF